ncbi:hypothetical protein IEE83_18065 [Dyadobacter sp. UP-52]|uniref:Uncharacterized protein n=1 Tax=Dyadobacter subterraneus TaxID=2773304 RepID=A0ABR9WE65_9BACT|nr:hypothetical protein [Dyadobacter subterraneus]
MVLNVENEKSITTVIWESLQTCAKDDSLLSPAGVLEDTFYLPQNTPFEGFCY